MAQLCLAAIAADRFRRVAVEHRVGDRRVQPLRYTGCRACRAGWTAGQPTASSGKGAADLQRIRHLAPVIVDQDGQVVVRIGLMEHFGGPAGGAGIADDGVGHGSDAPVPAEIVRRRRRGVADEADGADLAPRPARADAGGISHHLRHVRPGAVARVEAEEGDLRQLGAHDIGVVGRNAGGAELLQEQRFEIDQMLERAGEVKDRLAGADPFTLGVSQVDLDGDAARRRHRVQPVDGQPRRRDDRPAHENRIGHGDIAEFPHDALGPVEIGVGPGRDIGFRRMDFVHRRPFRNSLPIMSGAYSAAAWRPARWRPAFSISAIRKASSSDWLAFSRGSQWV